MNQSTPSSSGPKSPLEKLLGLFAEVRHGEAGTLLLLTLDVFLILAAYYVIKPVREALILAGGGAELKAYMSFFQTIVLLGFVPAYARLASSVTRQKLINSVTLFFCACLVGFYLLAQLDVPLGVAFYIWVGIFNVSVVAQFWSFANDVYTPEQGKRLFAIIGFGASSGAVLGPQLTKQLIEPLGVYQLLLVASAMLLISLLLTNVVVARERRRLGVPAGETLPAGQRTRSRDRDSANVRNTRREDTSGAGVRDHDEETLGKGGAFKLVFQHRYLVLIAFLMLLLNWVNTTGEYILSRVVESRAEQLAAGDPDFETHTFIGKFYGDFFSVVNIASLLIQLFLVSRILKYLGVRIALLILPVIALGGYVLVAVAPVLGLIRWVKTAENATDYSLQNTLRGVLFLPTTREQKYKAKQAIDTFFVRAGDALQAGLVFAGTTWLAFQTEHFAMVNIGLVLIWLVLAGMVGREFARRTRDAEAQKKSEESSST